MIDLVAHSFPNNLVLFLIQFGMTSGMRFSATASRRRRFSTYEDGGTYDMKFCLGQRPIAISPFYFLR